jgi:putative hemolysin
MLLPLLILCILMLLNGVFAMSELAMMTSRQSRLQQAAAKGHRGAAVALTLAREPTRFLSTVQVGITLIGILAGAFGEKALSGELEALVARLPALAPHADVISLVLVVLAITYFSLVVGELVPKRIALAHPELIASTIARPLDLLSRVAAWPVRVLTVSTEALLKLLRIGPRVGDDISEDDVRALMSRAAATGVFTPQELRLFHRTMRAGDLLVKDLMVNRADIVWMEHDESVETVRVLVGTSPYSHFPVCKGSLDQMVGVVHIKDLISFGLLAGTEFKVTSVAREPLRVPEHMPALRLLDQFQTSRVHIAFVVNEREEIQGLLTLNDVTRAIVGDVSRAGSSDLPTMTRRNRNEWFVDGGVAVRDLASAMKLPMAADGPSPATTVAELLTTRVNRVPRLGDTITWQECRIEVADMDGHRVDKVIVSRTTADHAVRHSPRA